MKEKNIQMVDLMGQYHKIKQEIDHNIVSLIESGKFVNGPIVNEFATNLSAFLNVKNVITCANGTDALQIAFMALNLKPGDEIICPSWTYIATAEAAAVLGIKVIFELDKSKPNGTPRKILDNTISRKYGWVPNNNIKKAIKTTYRDFIKIETKL